MSDRTGHAANVARLPDDGLWLAGDVGGVDLLGPRFLRDFLDADLASGRIDPSRYSAAARAVAARLPQAQNECGEIRWGVPIEDLVQQGNLGLLRAAEKYDADKQVRLRLAAGRVWAGGEPADASDKERVQ